ncbi:MAG TPA: hypothetical protein PLN91_00945 [Rhodanobacteraceae bacterium]|nr:hypothetical protein [Rhodanobacteraceae bacterium]
MNTALRPAVTPMLHPADKNRAVHITSLLDLPRTLDALKRGDAVFFEGWCFEIGGGVQGLDETGQPIATRRVWASGPHGEFDAFRGWRGEELRRLRQLVASAGEAPQSPRRPITS